MPLFQRIFGTKDPAVSTPPRSSAGASSPPDAPPPQERRRAPRFVVSPDFPLKAVLGFVGRDESGVPLSSSPHGWNWKGRLIDCSEQGARILLGPGLRAVIGETCDLRLAVQGFELTVPCHVTNIREQADGVVFGLRHDITDAAILRDYRQLVEVVALGSTLRLRTKTPQPDESGYLVERYASSRPSRLTVWRHPEGGMVSAFEFILKHSLVRTAVGQGLEYFSGDGTGFRPAAAVDCAEIHRLFQWTVPNLPAAIPTDVRAFLRHYLS